MEGAATEDFGFSEDDERALDLMLTSRAWPPLAHREKGGYGIDLVGARYHGLPAHRRILLLLLQLAIKDRATELHFEPWRSPEVKDEIGGEGSGVRLSYVVADEPHELVPPPGIVLPHLSRDIETIARLDGLRPRAAYLLRQVASKLDDQGPGLRCGRFTLSVRDAKIDVQVLAYPGECGERYILRFPPIPPAASETAGAELRKIFEIRQA